jgi:hypothetical protein
VRRQQNVVVLLTDVRFDDPQQASKIAVFF